MPKTPLSVTLDELNLLWLRGRAAGRKKRSLSDALDEILTEARRGGRGGDAVRSVVGTVDIAGDDPTLARADAAVRSLVDNSLGVPRRASARHDGRPTAPARKPAPRKRRV